MPEEPLDSRAPLLVRLALGAERRLSGLEPDRVTVGDHEVHYLERNPEREEALLCVHGFGADKDNWVRFVRHLGPFKKTHRIVALDLPGSGDSTRLGEAPYDVLAQAERLHAFVEALELGPLHLVGSSMGGAIAGRYAASYPERVGSLCLIEPLALRGPEPSEMERRLARGELPLVAESREEYEALLDFVFEKRPFLPAFLRRHLARRAVARRAHLKRVWKEIWDDLPEPPAGHLNTLQVRTLLLWGDTDRVFHRSAMVELETRLPRVAGHVFPDCGHLPMVERPREAAERFLAWFREIYDV